MAVDGGRETERGDRSGAGREGERTERRSVGNRQEALTARRGTGMRTCRKGEMVGQEPGGGTDWTGRNREETLLGPRGKERRPSQDGTAGTTTKNRRIVDAPDTYIIVR